MLEPYEGKLSRTVLRGGGGSNTADLPDQLIENKQKFIGQIMTSKSPVRSCEDIDEAALTYAEVKALATGNPYIKEKMSLDVDVSKLKLLKANHTSQIYRMEDNISKHYPMKIAALTEQIAGYKADILTHAANRPADKEAFAMRVGNRVFTEKKEAGMALIEMCRMAKQSNAAIAIGEYRGFKMEVSFDAFFSKFAITLKGQLSHKVEIGADALGNIQRLNNALEAMSPKMEEAEQQLANVQKQLETAKEEVKKPFEKEAELKEKLERLSELNALLNMDEHGDNPIGMEMEESEAEMPQVAENSMVREAVAYGVSMPQENDIVVAFKNRTEQFFQNIGQYSLADIGQNIKSYVQEKIEEYGLDAKIVDMAVIGSRSRGIGQKNADLDVAVEFMGNEREDALFEIFHEDSFTIDGVKVDINPIKAEKTGTLEMYLPKAEKYLAEKKNALQRENKKQHGRISIREKLAEKRAVVMTQSKEKLKTHEQTKSTKNAER